jgi:hypothetical protein
LAANSKLFPIVEEREELKQILEKYGAWLSPRAPLGYSGSGLLLAFEHSIPDNSFPIFWAENPNWRPLLSRGSPSRQA